VKIIPALSGANVVFVDFRPRRVVAQSLSKIEPKQGVPNSQIIRPAWGTKGPVRSRRLFAVNQVGKILVIKKFGRQRREGIFQRRTPPSLISNREACGALRFLL
jgi:hypothetical protein